jgi:hypothetical protein
MKLKLEAVFCYIVTCEQLVTDAHCKLLFKNLFFLLAQKALRTTTVKQRGSPRSHPPNQSTREEALTASNSDTRKMIAPPNVSESLQQFLL